MLNGISYSGHVLVAGESKWIAFWNKQLRWQYLCVLLGYNNRLSVALLTFEGYESCLRKYFSPDKTFVNYRDFFFLRFLSILSNCRNFYYSFFNKSSIIALWFFVLYYKRNCSVESSRQNWRTFLQIFVFNIILDVSKCIPEFLLNSIAALKNSFQILTRLEQLWCVNKKIQQFWILHASFTKRIQTCARSLFHFQVSSTWIHTSSLRKYETYSIHRIYLLSLFRCVNSSWNSYYQTRDKNWIV